MMALEAACRDGMDLVCVMAANNEVGTLYPVEEVARIAGQAGAHTLIDATQAAGRVPIHAAAWGITYLTVSAHKLYGPRSYRIPGSYVTSNSMSAPSSALPRLRTLCTNSKNPR